jgi:hypothetical protein
MAFCFQRKESVRAAIRRLGVERMVDALRFRDGWPRSEPIHQTRKDIKRARALLRLARAAIRGRDRRRIDRRLKLAARSLAAPRDAFQAAETLTSLWRRFPRRVSPQRFRGLHASLLAAAAEEAARFARQGSAESVAKILRRVENDFARLDLKARGWNALGPGLRAAYRGARDAAGSFHESDSVDAAHLWRKRAKDLWFQLGLLEPIDPDSIGRLTAELSRLDGLLGEDHDLVVLGELARRRKRGGPGTAVLADLAALISERRRRLRVAIRASSARWLSEPTDRFCARLKRRWDSWRKRRRSDS